MSNRPVARSADVPAVQSRYRPRRQSAFRSGSELTLLTNISPNTGMTPIQRTILEDIGLDGHWLYTTVANWISSDFFDLDKPSWDRDAIEAAFMEEVLPDLLANELMSAALKNEHDEEEVRQLDAYIDENGHEIYHLAQAVLGEMLDFLANFETPKHLKYRTPENYLIGYSEADMYSGFLHFNLVDQ